MVLMMMMINCDDEGWRGVWHESGGVIYVLTLESAEEALVAVLGVYGKPWERGQGLMVAWLGDMRSGGRPRPR